MVPPTTSRTPEDGEGTAGAHDPEHQEQAAHPHQGQQLHPEADRCGDRREEACTAEERSDLFGKRPPARRTAHGRDPGTKKMAAEESDRLAERSGASPSRITGSEAR